MSVPWPPNQAAMVRRLGGKVAPDELARRLSAIGPVRSRVALHRWATRHRLCLRVGRGASRLPDRRWYPWSPDEDVMLRSLVGRMSVDDVAERLTRRFGTERRCHGVRKRAYTLGLSIERTDGIGMEALGQTFAMRDRSIRAEVDAGHLRAEQRGNGRRGGQWLFLPADIEAWVRARPHLLDWREVAPGRWRDLVRAGSLRAPYLSVREIAARARTRPRLVQQWIREGRIDGVVPAGASRFAGWRIPLRALAQIEQLADGTRQEVTA